MGFVTTKLRNFIEKGAFSAQIQAKMNKKRPGLYFLCHTFMLAQYFLLLLQSNKVTKRPSSFQFPI